MSTLEQTYLIQLLQSVITVLEEISKSEDISKLLLSMATDDVCLENDFLIEFSLTASPLEEEGVGCFSLAHLKKALLDLKENETTTLLNEAR